MILYDMILYDMIWYDMNIIPHKVERKDRYKVAYEGIGGPCK